MYANRGETPNINTPNNDSHDNVHYDVYYHVNYDNTFYTMGVIASFIVMAMILAIYFLYYRTFNDPIANLKESFLKAQIIIIIATLVLFIGILTFFLKNKKKLIIGLTIIFIISLIAFIILFSIKIHLDNKYNNEETFSEFYETYEQPNKDNSRKLVIDTSKTEKELYIKNSMNSYNNFNIKVVIYMIIHAVIIAIIVFLIYKFSTIEGKKKKVYKNDTVLFDEEENVKL